MAKPITEPRPLSGKTARRFLENLKNAEADPQRQERFERDKADHEKIIRQRTTYTEFCEQCGDCLDCYGEDDCPFGGKH